MYNQRIIIYFICLSVLFSLPTWYWDSIKDDKLFFLIRDLSRSSRNCLLPLLAYFLTRHKIYGFTFLIYFFWTLTNPISDIMEYYKLTELWMATVKKAGVIIIGIHLLTRIKKYGY